MRRRESTQTDLLVKRGVRSCELHTFIPSWSHEADQSRVVLLRDLAGFSFFEPIQAKKPRRSTDGTENRSRDGSSSCGDAPGSFGSAYVTFSKFSPVQRQKYSSVLALAHEIRIMIIGSKDRRRSYTYIYSEQCKNNVQYFGKTYSSRPLIPVGKRKFSHV